MILRRIGCVALGLLFATSSTLVVGCGGDPPPAPVTPAAPPPAEAAPPPVVPAPTASTPPAKPEVAWTPIVDFVSLPTTRPAKPEDKKVLGMLTDIKKTHKECAAATPTVTSQSATFGAFTNKTAKENAYIVEWDCSPKGAKAPSAALVFRRLVIVGLDKANVADKLSREVEIPEHIIGAMTDIDSDGDNELVLVTSPGLISARLVELGDAPPGAVAHVFTWTALGTTECVAGEHDAPKLLYRKKAEAQEFISEKGKRPCPAAPATAPKSSR